MKRWIPFILTLALLVPIGAEAAIVVVVNNANPTEKMSERELIDMYMGRNLYFANGQLALRLDHSPKSSVRRDFYRQLVGKTVAQVNAYWARLLFTGTAAPPHVIPDKSEVIEAVKKNVNAIGYIDEADLVEDLKVVGRID
ncbi:MAG: hypothetical protein MI867_20710 [Pseudomonadales bacterium]|nr:hypothetical protein [Pseudomonadales bacterium]